MKAYLGGAIQVHGGDCFEVLKTLADDSIDAVVTDPPYGLEFMGKDWDAPWQTSSKSALFGKRDRPTPGWATTRNPNCTMCHGRLRGLKFCTCETPTWDEAPTATNLRQMRAFQEWCEDWAREVLRVLKPGGHCVAFSGTRTYHRMACAIEDAGFEIRDQLAWTYGSGFPKSHDVSKGIDKALGGERERIKPRSVIGHQCNIGNVRPYMNDPDHMTVSDEPATDAARQWEGWGTALKPAWEPICLARKPLSEKTVAANVLRWGTGAINVDGCRIEGIKDVPASPRRAAQNATYGDLSNDPGTGSGWDKNVGRFPANLCHDGSQEVLALFPETKSKGRFPGKQTVRAPIAFIANPGADGMSPERNMGDSGSAARFFYTAKADADNRLGSKHPTVKPLDLMQWLVRLVTPSNGVVLDCFAGTGVTGEAAWAEGFKAVLIERETEYLADIERRMTMALASMRERGEAIVKAHNKIDDGPLFGRLI